MDALFRGGIALALVVAFAGCQKPADSTAAPPAGDRRPGPHEPATPGVRPALEPVASASPAVTTREAEAVALMQQMGDIFSANLQDCDKLATELKAFIGEHRAALGALTAMLSKLSAQDQAAFEQRNKAAQDAISKKMQAGVVACGQNPNVQAALRELPGE
jgi:hypothetical protein